jgi:hypothetical protein
MAIGGTERTLLRNITFFELQVQRRMLLQGVLQVYTTSGNCIVKP